MTPPPESATASVPVAPLPRRSAARFALYPLGYTWAMPNTLIGLTFIPLALLSGGGFQVRRGAVDVYGGVVQWFLLTFCRGAGAMTLGHVIIAQDKYWLDRTHNHEHVHVAQYMRWGPFFLPMYCLSSFQCWRKGKNPYLENRFEIEAYGKFPC